MAGQAHDVATYQTTYGVSAPRNRGTFPSKKARQRAIDGRLGTIEPHYLYTSIPAGRGGHGNVVGACCEILTLQPYFLDTEGTLRTVNAVARETRNGKDRRFCPNCEEFAQKAANQFLGLRIIDTVTGTIYQSDQTKAAFATAAAQQAFKEQQMAAQQKISHDAYLAQQMSQLSVVPQSAMPKTVKYYQQTQSAPTFPLAGPSNTDESSKKSTRRSKSNKTTLRY
ncbi:hypothetical protein B0H15DRAFT_818410 [Mycena belliarum]|uniref:Uncharacterized protein n=1 Tax=Mycena belliarum TaxID=1033014 RepID=A0AAD6UFX8_9AGAR|nr:hypothetical protein B0H15DRAFT_818410 [Mycena belliae]